MIERLKGMEKENLIQLDRFTVGIKVFERVGESSFKLIKKENSVFVRVESNGCNDR